MNKQIAGWGIFLLFVFSSQAFSGQRILYDNSIYSTYWFPGAFTEACDYGISTSGIATKIRFGYVTTLSDPGTITIRFYEFVAASYPPDLILRQIDVTGLPGSPDGSPTLHYKELELTKAQRFQLFTSNFGYSFEFTNNNTGLAIAEGGVGNQDHFWLYDDWLASWQLTFFGGNPHAGFSMQIYEDLGPPIDEITCDIKGYKFNDFDSDGIRDNDEPTIPHWHMYLDENSDGQYQPAEPNVVTDPNGMYFFENLDSPAVYTVREVMKDDWTQTLPGGPDYQYVINSEPNNVYAGYDFGNITQLPDIKLYGLVETQDQWDIVSNVRVETDAGSSSPGLFDYTNPNGYYEIVVPAPFTGSLTLFREGWQQYTVSVNHTSLITNYWQDFTMLYLYGGGAGSVGNPFQIHTPEQMNFIGRQSAHWDRNFILMNDLDLSDFTGTDYQIPGPTISVPFEGSFDGNGFTISNFSYSGTDVFQSVGLFGIVQSANSEIKNLRVLNPQMDIPNSDNAAPLVGHLIHGTITNCHVSGGTVNAEYYAGGLAGKTSAFDDPQSGGMIEQCSSSCDVTAIQDHAGGLVGLSEGVVRNSFATGSATSFLFVGGLVGETRQYISATQGGLQNCYAWGSVNGNGATGGLIGYNSWADVEHCYSMGPVPIGGGLCGQAVTGNFIACFWDTTSSGQSDSAGGTGLETTEMQSQQTYLSAGWDFNTVWRICNGTNYPRLQWEQKQLADFVCPDGVEINDLDTLAGEWLLDKVDADFVANGFVDLLDWQRLAAAWQTTPASGNWDAVCDIAPAGGDDVVDLLDLEALTDSWLVQSAWLCDIAPAPDGDGKVNLLDFSLFTEYWMLETGL